MPREERDKHARTGSAGAASDGSRPSTRSLPEPRRVRKLAAVAVLTAAVAGSTAGSSAALCVIVDPVVVVGCAEARDASPPPPSPSPSLSARHASAPTQAVRLTSTVARFDARRLTVTFEPGTKSERIDAVLARSRVEIELAIPQLRTYLVGVDPADRERALASLRRADSVESAGREPLVDALDTTPNDRDWPQQVGLRVAGFPRAWDVTRGASSVVVAVVDTGVDSTQPELHGALVPGYDFVNGDGDPSDDHGHGTAVAGIIAARSDNGQGATGVCWRCSIMPIKVLGADGVGADTTVAAGIVWAADHGAKVINVSLGGPGGSPDLSAAVDYAVARGAVVVAAAGNSGSTVPFYPAADANVVSVAATTPDDKAYSWTNFGEWVAVAAPGCNIAPLLGGGEGTFCGTSSAAPVVAGLVALELSAEPQATASAVTRALQDGARPLPELVKFGRINAAQALSLLGGATGSERITSRLSGSVGGGAPARTFRLATGTGDLTATLRFAGGSRLTAKVRSQTGFTVARVVGRSPLRLRAAVAAGVVAVTVETHSRLRTRFALSVDRFRPEPAVASSAGPG